MFKPEYTAAQLANALSRTLNSLKVKEVPKHPPEQIQWIKSTSDAIIDTIELEIIKFKKTNPKYTVMGNDIVSSLQTTLTRFLDALKGSNKKD